MELVDDEKLNIEVQLLLDHLVHQTVCFFNRANGKINVRCPDAFALGVERNDLEIDVFSESTQVLRLLRHYAHVWKDVYCSFSEP